MSTPPELSSLKSKSIKKQGFLNYEVVHLCSFLVCLLCLFIAVTACILAVWDFANRDVLWRTVATCLILGAGMLVFHSIKFSYGKEKIE